MAKAVVPVFIIYVKLYKIFFMNRRRNFSIYVE